MHLFAYRFEIYTKLHKQKSDYSIPGGFPMASVMRSWPLNGVNWQEVGLAYLTFLGDASVGIRHILRAERHSMWQQLVMRRLARQAAHLSGRQIAIDLAELVQLPPETLGGAYARHMLSLGLDPAAFLTPEDDWLDQRAAIGHDIFHVIAGYDASVVGEFGVAAFTFVQYWDLLNVFVLSFVPLSLTNPRWTVRLGLALVRGFRMGWVSQPVVAYAVEENWDKPLAQVRRELGIGQFFS
jgi:ubiquinone biosynthesis protein Coq4